MNHGGTKPAGRPRQFDTDAVLDGALDLFWTRGYRETSTRDLERLLGITQSSLYNAFGSKAELLEAAVDRYEANVERDLLCLLEPGGGYGAVDRFLAGLARWMVDNGTRGCLVVNLMASEIDDERIARRVVAYRSKIRGAIDGALGGEAGLSEAERRRRADILLAAVLGLHITARSKRDLAEVDGMIAALRDLVAAWQATARAGADAD